MYELPLFPLNTVMFPGMPMRLHIFEERYKLMINTCYSEGRAFGIVCIEKGTETSRRVQPYAMGCTVVITEIEPLMDGRLNIVVVAQERFRVLDLQRNKPYLVGIVEEMPIVGEGDAQLTRISRVLRPWVRRYLAILAEMSNSPVDTGPLPQDPLRLIYLSAFLLQISLEQKQELLMIDTMEEFGKQLRLMYRREVTVLKAMLSAHEQPMIGQFSIN